MIASVAVALSFVDLVLAMFHHKSIEKMKLLKYLLVLIIAVSAYSCVEEPVGPVLGDEDIIIPPPPPPPCCKP